METEKHKRERRVTVLNPSSKPPAEPHRLGFPSSHFLYTRTGCPVKSSHFPNEICQRSHPLLQVVANGQSTSALLGVEYFGFYSFSLPLLVSFHLRDFYELSFLTFVRPFHPILTHVTDDPQCSSH